MCQCKTNKVDLKPGQRRKGSTFVVNPKWMGRRKHNACIRCSPTTYTVTRLICPWLDSKLKIRLIRKHHSHNYLVLWEDQAFFWVQKRNWSEQTKAQPVCQPASSSTQPCLLSQRKTENSHRTHLCMKHAKIFPWGWSRGSFWVTIYRPLCTTTLPFRN